MKKRKVFIAALLVAAAVSVAVVSCKKEKQETSSSNNTEQAVQSADNMDEYLISFKKKLLSAQKGDETISIEQAQQDLGNLLNFDFGDANYETNIYQIDTINVKLTLSEGQVDFSELALTYQNAVHSILDVYHKIDLPEKSISSILCQFYETENKDNDTEDVEIIMATRGYSPTYLMLNDHDTLDWRPKNFAGSCDGQFVGLYGAPETIMRWIYWSRPLASCANGGRMYLTDVDHWKTYGHHHYDSGTGLFKIYTSFIDDQNSVCIPHDEMEYYYSQILNLYYQQPFSNHYIDHVQISHLKFLNGYIPGLNEIRTFYTWSVTIRHGKINCTGQSPLD
jgi:hypothetical protein